MTQRDLIDSIWQPPTSGKDYRAIWLIEDEVDDDLLNKFEVAIVETSGKRRQIYPIATYTNLRACTTRITAINNYLANLDNEWLANRKATP